MKFPFHLTFKPWRAKPNKSYDSLFSKWEHWCSERGSDLISGPVMEAANFLAYLFKGGFISIVPLTSIDLPYLEYTAGLMGPLWDNTH